MSQNEFLGGFHAVEALLDTQPERLVRVWLAREGHDARGGAIRDRVARLGVTVETITRSRLDARFDGFVTQGIVAEARPRAVLAEDALHGLIDSGGDSFLVLDGVTDPHNLGACLRTAAAAGVTAVVQPRDRSAPLNTVATRAAAGAAERIPLIHVTNLARTLQELQGAGFWVVGLAGDSSGSLYDFDWPEKWVIVMGAEGKGLRQRTRACCDHLVSIPMAGGMESLNVSVATGVALFEARRRRG